MVRILTDISDDVMFENVWYESTWWQWYHNYRFIGLWSNIWQGRLIGIRPAKEKINLNCFNKIHVGSSKLSLANCTIMSLIIVWYQFGHLGNVDFYLSTTLNRKAPHSINLNFNLKGKGLAMVVEIETFFSF